MMWSSIPLIWNFVAESTKVGIGLDLLMKALDAYSQVR